MTHQRQYLPQCDTVLVMEGGRIVDRGTYAELAARGVTHVAAMHGRWVGVVQRLLAGWLVALVGRLCLPGSAAAQVLFEFGCFLISDAHFGLLHPSQVSVVGERGSSMLTALLMNMRLISSSLGSCLCWRCRYMHGSCAAVRRSVGHRSYRPW